MKIVQHDYAERFPFRNISWREQDDYDKFQSITLEHFQDDLDIKTGRSGQLRNYVGVSIAEMCQSISGYAEFNPPEGGLQAIKNVVQEMATEIFNFLMARLRESEMEEAEEEAEEALKRWTS